MRTLALTAAMAAGVLVASGVPSSQATPLPVVSKSLTLESVVHEARHRRSCRRVHWICRDRWGWGWRYRRCLRRHGC